MASEAAQPDREQRVDALVAEYLVAAESGQPIDEQAFLSSHPEYAEELRQVLSDCSWFDAMAAPLQSRYGGTLAPLAEEDDPSPASAAGEPARTTSMGAASAEPRNAPRIFGDFELVEELGCGGMGVVYRAKEPGLQRDVALKMLLSGQFASREEVVRFRREAKAAAHLQHEHIARILHVGEHEGIHYFTMDFIEGQNLAQRVREQGPLPARQAAKYLKKIAGAIQYAHQLGTYHRDIKPANILVDERDEPKVTDFGLAKRLDDDSDLTRDGSFFGTASYTSPEQASRRWAEVGGAGDVYSLGATLYFLLTGRPPFREETVEETLRAVVENDVVAPRQINRKISHDMETIVLKCLEKAPGRRYASAEHLADDLERFLNHEPIEAKPRGRLVRSFHWIRGLPSVARLSGRTLHKPTPAQKTTQHCITAITSLALLIVAVVLLWPKPYRVLANDPGLGRCYLQIAEWLCPALERRLDHAVKSVQTGGSDENVKRLLAGEADLALTHYGTNRYRTASIMTVAPVYYGVFYVVVRESSNIRNLDDLRQYNRIALGPRTMGMRSAAEKVLGAHEIYVDDLDPDTRDLPFETLLKDDAVDAGVITTGQGHPDLEGPNGLFRKGFRAISLSPVGVATLMKDQRGTRFTPVTVPDGRGGKINTVQSPVVLVARSEAPDALVEELLDALYDPDAKPPFPFLLSKENAAKFIAELDQGVHPVADRYFEAVGAGVSTR